MMKVAEAREALVAADDRLRRRIVRLHELARRWSKEQDALAAAIDEYDESVRIHREEVLHAWRLRQAVRTLRATADRIQPLPRRTSGLRYYRAAFEDATALRKILRASAVPSEHANRVSGIYFLLRAGECVYVGQSLDVHGRIREHRRDGKRFDAICYLRTAPALLLEREAHFIRLLQPILNRTGKAQGPVEPETAVTQPPLMPEASDTERRRPGPAKGSTYRRAGEWR